MAKQEKVDWLVAHLFYTMRIAFFVGRHCRSMTIKALDAQYMQEQLRRAGQPAPKVVGINEISIRTGHTSRIVVSDLERRWPIWFGGQARSEASTDAFYQWLGATKSKQIRLAVMDMWTAFRTSTLKPEHAPQAAILFGKFPVRASSWRGVGHGAQDRVRPPDGQGPTFHQGPEVYAPLAVAQGQPAIEHGLYPQGGVPKDSYCFETSDKILNIVPE
jgi:hypothetical protein